MTKRLVFALLASVTLLLAADKRKDQELYGIQPRHRIVNGKHYDLKPLSDWWAQYAALYSSGVKPKTPRPLPDWDSVGGYAVEIGSHETLLKRKSNPARYFLVRNLKASSLGVFTNCYAMNLKGWTEKTVGGERVRVEIWDHGTPAPIAKPQPKG